MKKIFLLSLAFTVMLLSSCKKETVDVTSLLKTVPSSAAGVVVFNMEDMLEDAGCKVKGHEVIPGETMKGLLDKASAGTQEQLKVLFEGGTGIEPKGALIFYDSNRAFLTFALYDVDMFCKYMQEKRGVEFTNEGNGVRVGGNIAVKGAQAWICLTSGKRIDADAIASYAGLSTSQSFLVTPMGEKLLVEENDVRGWAMLDTFMYQILSRSQRSMFTLGMGFLFENAESVSFKVDFDKGEIEAEAILLNDKGKPAKYQLPAEKVDVATLKGLGSTCDAMMAFTLNSKLIKKFEKVGNAFGGALFGDMGEMFKNVDGTIGMVTSGSGSSLSVEGVITTKGEASQTLKDMISGNVTSVKEEGKFLKFSQGDVKGNLSVAECAEELKGCCLGIVVDASGVNSMGYGKSPTGFKNYIVKLKPDSGGLELEFEANTVDEKANALEVLLQGM